MGELLDFCPLLFGIVRSGLLLFNKLMVGEALEFCSTTWEYSLNILCTQSGDTKTDQVEED